MASFPELTDAPAVKDLLRDLGELGYGVVPGVLEADELTALRVALDRAAKEDDAAGTASRYGPTRSNQRVWALLGRGDEFVRLAMHPLALAVTRAALGPDFLLSQLSANITAPGGDRDIGRLHTDQGYLPEPWPYLLAFNVCWFLDDFTPENGGTLVVPRSHTRLTYPAPDLAPATPAQLTGPAGAMAVVDGRLHHATGLNRTEDQIRRGLFATYCPPFIRGQENWCRSLPPDVLERYPEVAALTGFEEWQTLGGVNGPRGSGLNF